MKNQVLKYFFKIFKAKTKKEAKGKEFQQKHFVSIQLYHLLILGIQTAKLIQRVPALRAFWDLEKTVLHEIRVSGTVLWSPTNANSPTYTYISQKPW